MYVRTAFAILLSSIILALGWLQPQLILLDMPFGFALYVFDLLGKWEPGLLWTPNHRILAIICYGIWPVLVSGLFGSAITLITSKLFYGEQARSRLYAVLFLIALLVLSSQLA